MEEAIEILEKLVQNINRINERTLDCEVKQWIKEKQAIEIVLNELEKKDKAIDLIIDTIVSDEKILALVCKHIINKTENECYAQNKLCDDCIKEYFTNKVEKE